MVTVSRYSGTQTLTFTLDEPTPIRRVNTQRQIAHPSATAVYKIDTPIRVTALAVTGDSVITVIAEHDLLAGHPAYITPVGGLDKANAMSGLISVGVVLQDAIAGDPVAYISEGGVTRQDWTPITGTVNLRAGAIYYLASDGGLTNVLPTTGILQQIGVAASISMLDVEIQPPIQLA